MRYVDDFIVMIRPYKSVSNTDRLTLAREQILSTAQKLGVSLDKFDSGTRIVFLGIEIDTNDMCFRVPPDKKTHILRRLNSWAHKKHCRKRELDSLIGYLQFITRVIPWGRAFLGRWIKISCSKKRPRSHST